MALYIATRDITLTVLILYLSETGELLGASVIGVFAENIWDALFGDILIGASAVFNLWLLDQGDGADVAFQSLVSPWWRFLAFFFVFAWMPLTPAFPVDNTFTLGVLLFTGPYVLGSLWFYKPLFDNTTALPQKTLQQSLAARSILTWLCYTCIYVAAALPISDNVATSRFVRMLSVSIVLLGVSAVIIFARKGENL